MNKTMWISIILIILAAGGGFYVGMQYRNGGRTRGQFQQFQGRGGLGAAQGLTPVRGEVLSISDSNMTVKLQDGSSKIVILSGSTAFVKSDKAAKADVKEGAMIMVLGKQNADGSVTAQNVQVNPLQRK